MTRTTNARIAGFTYLFYTAIGLCLELLMHQARGVGTDAAKLARIGEYATNVRLSILIALLECFSSFVLAVTLYGITRDQDHELAMLALVCRVAEGVLGSIHNIPSYLGMLWLAKAGGAPGGPDIPTTNALRAYLFMPGASVPLGSIFFALGSLIFSYLLLRGRMVPVSIAWLGVFASGLLVVGLSPAARRFQHRAPDRILPVAAGARIPNRARAVAAHQRCRHTGDAMSAASQDM